MAETVKTQAALLAQMADGGDNTAEEVRDNIVSGWTPGWVRYLDHRLPDETAHDDDVFFDQGAPASASSGTAVTGAGSASWTEGYGRLSVESSNQGSFMPEVAARVFSLTPNSAPVTIETRWSVMANAGDDNNEPAVFVGFSDGATTGSSIAALYTYNDNASSDEGLQFYHAEGTFAATTAGTLTANKITMVPLYVRAAWTGANTFEYAISIDGVTWTTRGIGSDSVTLTPTHFFVGAGNANASLATIVTFDYIRVTESDLVSP